MDAAPPVNASMALFAGTVDKYVKKFESSINSRARMTQYGLIGMLLALWIIWWRK